MLPTARPYLSAICRAVFVASLCTVSACGLLGGRAAAPIEDRLPRAAPAIEVTPAAPARYGDTAQALLAHYRQWQGTPYRLGGTTRAGIDCSGYVARAFHDGLGIVLPRTTEAQAQQGRRIDRDELALGDLVFFKTGVNSRHVGIYLRNGEFVHASRQRGVMVSKLANRYWRAKYWQARRVLE